MIIIYKQDGSIFSKADSDYVQQGSNDVNKIFVAFVDSANQNWSANARFVRANDTETNQVGIPTTFTYNGINYSGWVFNLSSAETYYAGNLRVFISFYDAGGSIKNTYITNIIVNATGYPVDEDVSTPITTAEFNSYMAQIAAKQPLKGMTSVVVETLPPSGVVGVLYFLKGSLTDKVYSQYIWNGSAFVWVGSLVLDTFATLEEQKAFEEELQAEWQEYQDDLNTRWNNYKNSLDLGFETFKQQVNVKVDNALNMTPIPVATVNDLPSGGATQPYVVQENGYWYYWNGSQWVQGQQYQAITGYKTLSLGTLNKDYVDNIVANAGSLCFISLEGKGQDLVDETLSSAIIGDGYAWYESESNKVLLWLHDNLYEVVRNPDATGNYYLRDFINAEKVPFDSTSSGLDATNVQGAIDLLISKETISKTVCSIEDITNNTVDYETYDGYYIGSYGTFAAYDGFSVKFVPLKYGESLEIKVKNIANMFTMFVYCYMGSQEANPNNAYNHRPMIKYDFNGDDGSITRYITNNLDPIIYIGITFQNNYSGNKILKYTPIDKNIFNKYDVVEVLREHPFVMEGEYVGSSGSYPNYVESSACSSVFSISPGEILIVKGKTYEYVACAGRMANKEGTEGYDMPILPYREEGTIFDYEIYTPTQEKEYFRLSTYPFYARTTTNTRAFILKPKQEINKYNGLKQELKLAGKLNYLSLLCQRALCIGDSLTQGYCGKDNNSSPINSNYSYPYFLSKLTSWYIDNAGVSGITPIDWWTYQRNKYDFTKYEFFFLFLGGNGTLTDTIDEDTNNNSDDYENYANTNTGRFCSIIKMIQTINPNAKIFILNGYRNVNVINAIANFYDLPVIILNDPITNLLPVMGSNIDDLWNNSHPSIKGYLNMAVDVLDFITNYVFDNPEKFIMTPKPQTTVNYNITHESNLPTEIGDYYLSVSDAGNGKFKYGFKKV